MVETRSSSKSDSRVTRSTTKRRKKTATNFTVKVSKASRKTTKKANSTKNARTSPKPTLVTEFDLVQEHYAELCAREYRAVNEGRQPSIAYLIEKQAEFLRMTRKQQLEIREKYRAERKKNEEHESSSDSDAEPADEFDFVQVYYTDSCRKQYMADNGGQQPSRKYLDEKQLEFFNMTLERKLEIREKYLADKKQREREEYQRFGYTFG